MNNFEASKIIVFLYSLFLYPVVINRFSMLCYALIYGLPLIYLFIYHRYVNWLLGKVRIKFATVIFGVIILIALSVFMPVLTGGWDFSYVNVTLAIVRKFIIVLFLIVVTIKKHKENADIKLFMYYYVLATCCYVF